MQLNEVIESITENFNSDSGCIQQQVHNSLFLLIPCAAQVAKPAQGNTLQRWQILSRLAAVNLSLAKLFESHLDALTIMQELQPDCPLQHDSGLWAVWAAEGGAVPLQLNREEYSISGVKPWCSAAEWVDYALMTVREDNQSQLLKLNLSELTIQKNLENWHAVGMQHTQTYSLSFQQTPVEIFATPNAYLDRSGFWHGAAGVAMCWYGAAQRLATYLQQATIIKSHPYKHMYLGEITSQMLATRALISQTAQLLDAKPQFTHELQIRALRANIERTALHVLQRCGEALGAAPYCQNAHFAQLAADLPVFIRQSHAAFDLEQIGQSVVMEVEPWAL